MLKVIINNIQSITSGVYILERGITVIKGENSHGKSIFRKAFALMADRKALLDEEERCGKISWGASQGELILQHGNKVLQLRIGYTRIDTTLGVFEQKENTLEAIHPLARCTDAEGWSKALELFGIIETIEGISPHVIHPTGKKLFYTTSPAEDYAYLDVTTGDALVDAFVNAMPAFLEATKRKLNEIETLKQNTINSMRLLNSYRMSEAEEKELAVLESFTFDLQLFNKPKLLRPVIYVDCFNSITKKEKVLAYVALSQLSPFNKGNKDSALNSLARVESYKNGICPECLQPLCEVNHV